MYEAESDERLAARSIAGEVQAFQALASRYIKPLYNLALRLTRDPMEAENITQETLWRAWKALPQISLDRPLRPWMYKITVNLCRQWAERKRPQLFSDFDSADETGLEAIADQTPSALEQVEQAELEARVREQVQGLLPMEQTLITLRYVDGLSYLEMAEALEMPLNTIRTRLRRVKLKLRRTLLEDEK